MTDQEINSLRSKCRSLEKETRQLEVAKKRLECRLLAVQQSLDREQCTTKTLVGKRANDLLNLQRHYIDKFETATKLLKIRVQWELNQALQRQKEQLKMNFRSDLFMLTNKNTQLATMLSYTQQQLQQVDRSTEKRRVEKQLYTDDVYNKRLDNLRKEFERQTVQLLKELKERECTIERLQRSISTLPTNNPAEVSSNEGSHLEQITGEKSGGPVRNKNHRGIRVSKGPYNTSHTSPKKKRQKCTEENGKKMKELDIVHHSLESHHQPFYSLPSHHQTYHQYYNNHHLYQQQQYGQCGGSGLETLPEADSEEESLTTTKEDVFPSGSISTGSPSSQISSVDFSFQNACKIQESKSLEDFTIEEECEHETHKISLLESIIKQLRDELRECKDQNELLEFRLLEIEEVNSMSRQHPSIEGADGESEDSNAISCLSLPQVVSNGAEYESANGHSTVTESRSSCGSDCSESLSLQESGIFESQGSDDGTTGNGRNSISRELASLTFQIEELLRRYNESDEDSKERHILGDGNGLGSPKRKRSHDLASELHSCRQKIQEFERRLSQMNDINYLRSLEEKVNFLLRENKRVEEERAEIEEAENDNRHLCQRLEEKMTQLQKKKLSLQNKLALEKRQIEQLRSNIMEMQEREEDLCSKITKLEGLLQNYEQRNFELEESCIEMKCSVQFVIHSMPIFSLCYFWYLLRRFNGQQPMTFFNFFMESKERTKYTNGYQVKALPWPTGLLSISNVSSGSTVSSNSVNTLLSPRKHKLLEIPGVEPQLKKSKSLKERRALNVSNGDDYETNKIINMTSSSASSGDVEVVEVERMRMTNAEAQTGEELWKIFIEGMLLRQRAEWDRVEKSLRKKIEVLECDIDLCQEAFDKERSRLIEMYESKLGEKETELKEIRHCQNEKRELQDKWNCLIQELEQFALYLGKNLNEKTEGVSQFVDCGQLSFSSKMSIDAEMSDSPSSSHTANNTKSNLIQSLTFSLCNKESNFHQDQSNNRSNDSTTKESEMIEKTELIALLQSSLKSHLSRFEIREQQLLGEIDRLLSEIKSNAEKDAEAESNMISHLTEENNRLQALFKDHDKVWGDLKRLQDEHEKLKSELSDTMALRKRLEESQRSETELRERLEEEERTESALKSRLAQIERKEQKGLEKIQQLRDEIQFLRNKCCQLQDDIDMRAARENKYKNEIQSLASRLRESTLELEEKESQLESNESALQSQIAKLKSQLQELHQSYTDTECSNGMLREEVSYLEKTVEEAVSKAVESENAITALSHELKQKDVLIEELQTQLRQLKMTDSVSLSPVTPHELSDFNRNDGGLHGVVRAVEEVVSVIQRCSQCESLGAKLMGTVERLIPLIQILKSSHVTDFHFAACMTMMDDSTCSTADKILPPIKSSEQQTLEEDEVLIGRLQETMTRLALQITKLEESLNIRQKEIKDSHLTETALWKHRCEEKNSLIQLLARRIAHLSITDVQGYFITGILKEIEKLGNEYRKRLRSTTPMLRGSSGKLPLNPDDFSCDSLRSFLTTERKRIMELFESTSDETFGESDNQSPDYLKELDSRIDFRVLRRIGDDALLVCWTMPENFVGQQNVNGYEIAVNGSTYLKIPQPNRHKAVLFGLNLDEPLKLTFRCPGDLSLEETITFIS